MFDIGMVELLVIGVVALIVVGPKDLPGMFRTLGKFTAKARGMAREFQRSMEDAADESGVGDIAKDLKKATSMKNMGLDGVKSAVKDFSDAAFDADASRDRIEAAKKIDAAGEATKALAEKRAGQKTAAASKAAAKVAASKSEAAVKKPAAKKPAAKKPAAKKPATKAPAKAKVPAKKSAAKALPKKPAAKKPAAKPKTPKAKT